MNIPATQEEMKATASKLIGLVIEFSGSKSKLNGKIIAIEETENKQFGTMQTNVVFENGSIGINRFWNFIERSKATIIK